MWVIRTALACSRAQLLVRRPSAIIANTKAQCTSAGVALPFGSSNPPKRPSTPQQPNKLLKNLWEKGNANETLILVTTL